MIDFPRPSPASQYLRQVYLDIVSPLPLAMRYCYDMLGPERLLFASDRPWVSPREILSGLRRLGLPAEHETAILGGNPRRFYRVS